MAIAWGFQAPDTGVLEWTSGGPPSGLLTCGVAQAPRLCCPQGPPVVLEWVPSQEAPSS